MNMSSNSRITVSEEYLKTELHYFARTFNHITTNWPQTCAVRILHSADLLHGTPIYTLHMTPKGGFPTAWNRDTMPDVHPMLVTALQKLNQCDFSVRLFLDVLVKVFEPIGVQVQAMRMIVRRNLSMMINEHVDLGLCWHTVYWMVDADKNEYIMDLTIGQYGFPEEHNWFLPANEYFDRFLPPEAPMEMGMWNGLGDMPTKKEEGDEMEEGEEEEEMTDGKEEDKENEDPEGTGGDGEEPEKWSSWTAVVKIVEDAVPEDFLQLGGGEEGRSGAANVPQY